MYLLALNAAIRVVNPRQWHKVAVCLIGLTGFLERTVNEKPIAALLK